MVDLWRAVDAEGEVLDVLVQTRRNKGAAFKLMRGLIDAGVMGINPHSPDSITISGAGAASQLA
jgi:transposase-like protein